MERKPINSSLKFVNYIVNEVQFNYNKNQKDEKNWKLTFNFKNITKFNKELGISFLSVSFLIFLVKILIQHKFQRISIFSRILSKLVIAIINSLFQYLLIIGGILGIIGLMMIIIGVVGNYPKKKRG